MVGGYCGRRPSYWRRSGVAALRIDEPTGDDVMWPSRQGSPGVARARPKARPSKPRSHDCAARSLAPLRGLRGERSLERERREARDGGTQPTHLLLLERTAPRRRAGRESKAEKVWRSGNSAASSEVSTRLRWCERRLLGGAIQITKSSSRPILLKNSVRDAERAALRKSTSQIGPGSTIATSARVE